MSKTMLIGHFWDMSYKDELFYAMSENGLNLVCNESTMSDFSDLARFYRQIMNKSEIFLKIFYPPNCPSLIG